MLMFFNFEIKSTGEDGGTILEVESTDGDGNIDCGNSGTNDDMVLMASEIKITEI